MKPNKGIIFSGDSFTWGEGLELFSYLPSTDHYIDKKKYSMEGPFNFAWDPKFKYSHRMFQQKNRFARLVANHFNTWEDVYDRNGGCPYSNLDELFFQMDRTPLTDVSDIVIQITDIWRSVGVCLHPISHYFGLKECPPELSKKTICFKERFGNGNGLSIFDIDKNDLKENPAEYFHPNIFSKYNHQLHFIIQTALTYEGFVNGGMTLDESLEYTNSYIINTSYGSATETDLQKSYNFILTEYSDFGSNISEIYNNISLQLVRDYIWFIKEFIKPEADKHHIQITFIPPFNETFEWFLEANDPFYMENRVVLRYEDVVEESWFDYFSNRFDIQKTPGFEWSRNMHPNVEGHKIYANSIIHHLENKKIKKII